jgi:hypothetical protein
MRLRSITRAVQRLPAVAWDLCQATRLRGRIAPNVLFYCSAAVDEQWIRTALLECVRRGMKCALLVSDAGRLPVSAEYGAVPVFHCTPLLLRLVQCRVLVTASSGIPRKAMPAGCRHRVHMPHSLVSLHMIYPSDAFDAYDHIFCCGEHHVSEVAAMNALRSLPARRAARVGYGKLDTLAKEYAATLDADATLETVVVAPSWGKGNILETIGEHLVAELLDAGYHVVVRPHPAFFSSGAKTLRKLETRFGPEQRFEIEQPQLSNRSLLTADAMVSDYSGVALEYAFLRLRPVVFVDVPKKVLNADWEELGILPSELALRERLGTLTPPDAAAVSSAVRQSILTAEKWVPAIGALRERYVFSFGSCGPAAADEIARLLAQGEQAE